MLALSKTQVHGRIINEPPPVEQRERERESTFIVAVIIIFIFADTVHGAAQNTGKGFPFRLIHFSFFCSRSPALFFLIMYCLLFGLVH